VHTGFWWGNVKERGYLEDTSVDGKVILNWIFKNCDGARIGSIWRRKGTGCGLLWMREGIFRFRKRRRIYTIV